MKKLLFSMVCCMPLFAMAQLADSATRLVHVKGAVNFRDIGGYKTADGKTVKWNKLYRSADIGHLTDSDVDTLTNRHIKQVVDFRGVKESQQSPDRLPKGTAYMLMPAGSDSLPDAKQMMALIKAGSFLPEFYGNPQYLGARYKGFFSMLLTMPNDEALLYHCTGGRDRTGMATALLLYVLGVPMKTIEADFTASNAYLESMNQSMYQGMVQATGTDLETIKKSFELRPELLHAMFAGIEKKYGSVSNFMQTELNVGPKQIAELKAMYLN
ncbi:tyrosine-protein phosphatase [Deminuibacter soli]|uniref:Protein-tyrosine-phosphatase n=1 Tax=Deminuibacter soli TaxID=2291815 RepID=A0A3E1NDV5_9BACT|nr:tyrosine-protein phosphatase [Deminuibacter soli]RFM26149.1 protein-tyrosine-phosphatase [Deminuibacter soli]